MQNVDLQVEFRRDPLCLDYLPGGKVRQADIADLTPGFQLGESGHRLVQICIGIKPVQVKQVDHVHAQPLARDVELCVQVGGTSSTSIPRFRGDDHIIPLGPGELTQQRFRLAIGIDVRGIKMGQALGAARVIHRA